MTETLANPVSTAPEQPAQHTPMVSIGMPVYNGENYIREALDSLLAQTFTDFELIISDNASDDKTEVICNEYAARDNRIRYIRQPQNIGATANFRFVLDQAQGKYFMWAAHDDVRDTDFIEKASQTFLEDDACVLGTARILFGDKIVYTSTKTNFMKGSLVKFFLEDEAYSRTMYMYGLFKTSILRKADWKSLDDASFHWSDMHFLYSMIPFGNFRSIADTGITYRMKLPGQKQSVTIKKHSKLLRYTLLCHPWSYYRYYLKNSHGHAKFLIAITLPIKLIYGQLFLWWRGFRKLILGRDNFY